MLKETGHLLKIGVYLDRLYLLFLPTRVKYSLEDDTTTLLLLVIPCTKATNSARPGARQSTADSVVHVDQITTLYKSNPLLF